MNRPCGKWPVGKRISLQSDEHVYIFIENSYGLVRFWVPARWIPLESQKGFPKCIFLSKNMHKTFIYDGLGRASWESRGIDRAESTVRKMAWKHQISLQSGFVFQENGPWEHRFCLRVASFWNFQQQKRLRVASF